MEIISMYQVFSNLFNAFGMNVTQSLWYGLFGVVAVWLGLFVFQGIALYTMAGKENLEHKWLAFVPFANIFLMGKIAGECSMFGRKIKNLKVYVCISQVIAVALEFLMIAALMYLYIVVGEPNIDLNGRAYWDTIAGTAANSIARFYDVSGYLISIVNLVYEILFFLLLLGIFRKYAPSNYTMLGMLTLFVPVSRYIILFVLRKRKPVDFNAYMRAKREAFLRQQQQYGRQYQNPYGNPYQNQGNPYNPQPPKKPEEPFEEFASEKKSGESEQAEQSGTEDGFFH